MIKAVFFDVDGTLFSHASRSVPQSARAGLERLAAAGIRRVVSTGRHPAELRELPLGGLAFDGFVTLNGQLCLDGGGRPLFGAPFSEAAARALAELFREREMPLALVDGERIYINMVNGVVVHAQSEISTAVPDMAEYRSAPLYQATCFVGRGGEAELRRRLPGGCKLARWSESGVDIIPDPGGKVEGMRYFMSRFGLRREEVMAFGDEENDIDMLEYAGLGVAMGNAKAAVMAAADYVTAGVDEDGIEKALRRFGL